MTDIDAPMCMQKRRAYLGVSLQLFESHVIIMHGLSHQAKVSRCKNGLGWVTAGRLRHPICPMGDGEELELLSDLIHHLVMFTNQPPPVCTCQLQVKNTIGYFWTYLPLEISYSQIPTEVASLFIDICLTALEHPFFTAETVPALHMSLSQDESATGPSGTTFSVTDCSQMGTMRSSEKETHPDWMACSVLLQMLWLVRPSLPSHPEGNLKCRVCRKRSCCDPGLQTEAAMMNEASGPDPSSDHHQRLCSRPAVGILGLA